MFLWNSEVTCLVKFESAKIRISLQNTNVKFFNKTLIFLDEENVGMNLKKCVNDLELLFV